MGLELIKLSDQQKIINLIKDNKQTFIVKTDDKIVQQAVKKLIISKYKTSNFVEYQSDEISIKIETIRNIISSLKTKRSKRHFIFIDKIDTMTISAQNAFLKVLEEPIRGVYFVMFSKQPNKLLPTVLSRATFFSLTKNNSNQIEKIILGIDSKIEQTKLAKIKFMSNNNLEIAEKLLKDPKFYREQEKIASDAKELINCNNKQKIKIISKYFTGKDKQKDRQSSLQLLQYSAIIYQKILIKNNSSKIKKKLAKALENAKNIKQNGSVKLNLIDFVI